MEIQPTRLLPVPEVAQALSLSRSKVYELLGRGELRSLKIDGSRRVHIEDSEAFIDSFKASD